MSKIVIIGAGALGSHFLQFARNLANINWTIVDDDEIEAKNTSSQFHPVIGVGKSKAHILTQNMQLNWGFRPNAVPRRLVPENVDSLLRKSDVIVDCVDNSETRLLIRDYAEKNDIPVLHGAMAAGGEYAIVAWGRDFPIHNDKELVDLPTCEDGEFLPFIAIVAATMAQHLQVFLADGTKKNTHCYPGGFIQH